MNQYIEFYAKHNISPVRQDISDFDSHLKRRAALYANLGLPAFAFRGSRVLEVGPGGGYNSLATYCFGPDEYHLVEPNPAGFSELKDNFSKNGFDRNFYPHNCMLEDFDSDTKFDIVLCEGLVQGLPDKKTFLSKLAMFAAPGGMLVITAADQISMFFEIARRHMANVITSEENDFGKKLDIMVRAFASHLSTIKGMTRRHDDWCADLICDAIYNHSFSIEDAVSIVGGEFYLNETCPRYFTDSRWYKGLPRDTAEFNAERLKSFAAKWHGLMDYRHVFLPRSAEKNKELSILCRDLITEVQSQEKNRTDDKMILELVHSIIDNVKDMNPQTVRSIEEFADIVKKGRYVPEEISGMSVFASAFGRGQTFISFNKVF